MFALVLPILRCITKFKWWEVSHSKWGDVSMRCTSATPGAFDAHATYHFRARHHLSPVHSSIDPSALRLFSSQVLLSLSSLSLDRLHLWLYHDRPQLHWLAWQFYGLAAGKLVTVSVICIYRLALALPAACADRHCRCSLPLFKQPNFRRRLTVPSWTEWTMRGGA